MRFPFLDLVRAGACIWVALAHLTLISGHPVFILSQGNVAVDVFIFTSGFLMCLVYPAVKGFSLNQAVAFYVRRWFRIAPAFFLAVLLYVFWQQDFRGGLASAEVSFDTPFKDAFNQTPLSWRDIFLNFSFLHGLFPGASVSVFGPAWSISLEMQFYLVVPFMMAALRRSVALTLVLCFGINLLAYFSFGIWGISSPGWAWDYPYPSFLPNRIFLFAVGALACLYLQKQDRRLLILLGAAQAGVFGVCGYKSGAVMLTVTLLLLLSTRYAFFSRVCGWPGVKHLAEYSYGIYLFHMLVMGLLAGAMLHLFPESLSRTKAALIYGGAVLVIATLFSALVFHWLENPLREKGRKLAGSIIKRQPSTRRDQQATP